MRYIVLGIVVGLIGCGGVDAARIDGGRDGSAMEIGGSSGNTGVGGGGAAGTAGTSGSGGSAGRPLGAGCTDNSQCGSTICDSATTTCCNGLADSCNHCVGGYLTPMADGTSCGVGSCDSSLRHATLSACMAGACVDTVSDCCTVCGTTPGQCQDPSITGAPTVRCGCGSGPFGGCP